MNKSTISATVATLRVPDARLHYEVRGSGPALVLVGAPMDARSFAPVADLLAADYTVVTTDPRGINRSVLDDPASDSTPERRADDLAQLISHVDAGPAVVLGSSGGAVSVLALAQNHADLVDTVIAHEPPFYAMLDDREALRAGVEDIIATYHVGDVKGAWLKFLAQANIELPEYILDAMSSPDRDSQDIADERYQHDHMLRQTVDWEPDLGALRDGRTRVLVGIGEESGGQLCERVSLALASALTIEPTRFPGGHIGFADDPEAFATRLREVLAR